MAARVRVASATRDGRARGRWQVVVAVAATPRERGLKEAG